MKEVHVSFDSAGLKLEGLMYKPEAASRVAVVCHPHPLYGGSMNNNVVEAALEALWKLGFATLRFNFRGVGASEGEHAGGQGEIDDAKGAMRFMLGQAGVKQDGAIMAGYSFGAAVAIRAGADTREVGTIVAIALPVAMGDFLPAAKSGKRVVLIAGDGDAYCPERSISEFAERIGPGADLRIIAGADHFFGGEEAAVTSALTAAIGS